jgi:hypothetical protein
VVPLRDGPKLILLNGQHPFSRPFLAPSKNGKSSARTLRPTKELLTLSSAGAVDDSAKHAPRYNSRVSPNTQGCEE